jgi:hypothetical protein
VTGLAKTGAEGVSESLRHRYERASGETGHPLHVVRTIGIGETANASHGVKAQVAPQWNADASINPAGLPAVCHAFQEIPFEILDPSCADRGMCMGLSRLNAGSCSRAALVRLTTHALAEP